MGSVLRCFPHCDLSVPYNHRMLNSHCIVEGTKVQKSWVTWIRSHGLVREPGVEISQLLNQRTLNFCTIQFNNWYIDIVVILSYPEKLSYVSFFKNEDRNFLIFKIQYISRLIFNMYLSIFNMCLISLSYFPYIMFYFVFFLDYLNKSCYFDIMT